MFILESSLDGAGTIITNQILVKNTEAVANGEALVAASGRLTKCTATGVPQFVAAQTVAAGTDKQIDYIVVRREQTYLADISGSAATLAGAVGTKTACITADGLAVDAAALTGGNVEVVSVDTVKNKARVRFNL
jgi:hypothetical protein